MRTFIGGLFLLTATLANAQPVVTSVLNGGDASTQLCPGLEVIILGSNLGAFGAQSTITVGGQQAQIIQNGSGEVFAVLPSDLSAGPTTLTVSYNGQTSAPFSITLAEYAPAIAQINSAYFFPTCPQCFDPINNQPPGINAANPAAPGSQVGTFMVGLGANPVPLPVVSVGGQTAQDVTEQGDEKAGYYDVIFTVPNGLAAGPQPVIVSVAGVSAPPRTLYVGVALPSISAIENAASGAVESASHAAAPNSILSIYAANAGNTTAIPSAYPTTTVEGVQVLVNGTAVPIYALVPAAGQINVQLPSELPTTGTATVSVSTASGASADFTLTLGPADVGIFRIPSSAYPNSAAIQFAGAVWDVMPAALASSYGLPACIGLANTTLCGEPAKPGQDIVIYWTGGGPTTPLLPAGQVAPVDGSTLYRTTQTPTVTIGGIPATVSFSGITPGTAGEYQVNTTIPATAPVGDQVPLVVSIGNSSDTATIAVAAP